MNLVTIHRLTKKFGKTTALKNVQLEIKKGEVHGFIGPNGAGKSTTIRILLGLLKKTSGEIQLLGGDPWKDAVRLHRHIVYVPGDVSLWPDLSGGEVIDLLGRLHGGVDTEKKKNLIKKFQLDPTKKSSTYSKGNRQKVALIAALACDAELYIFDEPTSGLDPLMEATFQQSVLELKKKGKTILLSSHILSEVETLCDRVSIIRQGEIVETGTLEQLRHLTRNTVTVTTIKPVDTITQLKNVYDLKQTKNKLRFSVDSSEMGRIMAFILPYGIQSFTAEPPSLEDLFMRHYGKDGEK